jgi:hypothetical protein
VSYNIWKRHMPDGLFSNQKPSFFIFWGPFESKIWCFMTIWILCGHLLYCMAFWFILWSFFYKYDPHFGTEKKIWQPYDHTTK